MKSEPKLHFLPQYMPKEPEKRTPKKRAGQRQDSGCAEFIAALVVRESLGDAGARAGVLAHYRALYSRRYAFREELRRYGMYW